MLASDVVARLQRAQRAVAEAGLTALLISPGPDLHYLTGYDALPLGRLTCLVLPAVGDVKIVVPSVEELCATASPLAVAHVEILPWHDGDDPYALVAGVLSQRGTVGVNDRMWAAHALALRAVLPGFEQRSAGSVMKVLRVTKSENEVAALREAAAAIDQVHARVGEWLCRGRTEREVAADIGFGILQAGHATVDFVIVASGPNGANPHHLVSDRVIELGDPVVVDIAGTMPSGYCSDSTRTYVIGEPPDDFRVIYAVLEAAQEAACSAVKAGVPAETVDAAAREIIAEAGYGECFIHRTGHGIGLETHEEPYIAAGNREPLRPGMVFSVEPGIHLRGRFGARIEDIVACHDLAGERLTLRPRNLVSVDS